MNFHLDAPQPKQRWTRRKFLLTTSALAAGSMWGVNRQRESLQLVQVAVPMPGLPAKLDGLKVALMADWHCGPLNSQDFLRSAVQLANSSKPDLVVLPGDFVKNRVRQFGLAAELVHMLRPNISGGVLATRGNHDNWTGARECDQQLSAAGALMLENSAVRLTADRDLEEGFGPAGLCLAGVGDYWTSQVLLEETLASVPLNTPRLVLSHNPDVAERFSKPLVDLMVSGHTHGGQVRLPFLGAPIIPSSFGQKYAAGWCQGPGYPVYVTRGVGVGGLPIRFGVRPEVTLLTLQCRPARREA